MEHGRFRKLVESFAFSCVLVAGNALAAIPPSERAVLDALYAQTGGSNWTNHNGWGGTAGSECTWFGITCAADNNNVTTINLPNNNLAGTLPAITALTQLQGFYANNNQLTGNLPSVSGLTGLIQFRVQFNQLSGSIPPLTGLPSMQIYSVGSNQLTGTLPSLAGLTSLQTFNAYTNHLTGTIPPLTGLTNLVQVNVSSNSLSGSIPTVAGLVHLVFLVFDENQLTGSIPPLDGLTNLAQFTASNNLLTGSIPNLSSLVNLGQFWAYNNQLTGGIPALTGLVNLEDFEVDGNRLSGSLPALTGLTKLNTVLAGFNQLTGNLPSLAGLSNLQTFVVRDTQLTGNIPSLAGLTNLQIFAVFNSQLTGPIPPLAGLINLQLFGVQNNQLTGPIPALDGLSNLSFFSVANNRLTGSIPSLTNLPALQYLQVGGNGLSGNVPTAPATLLSVPFAQNPSLGQSTLCNNALNPVTDAAWDAATGSSPWYAGCTVTPSVLTLTTIDNIVATGIKTTITAAVTTTATPGNAINAVTDAAGVSLGTVTVTDDDGALVCYIKLDSGGTGSCDVLLPGGSTTDLNGGYSGGTGIAPASAAFSKSTPVAVSGNLDQHGWTGAWYNPATSGQGIIFEVYPDIGGLGIGAIGGGWFTYDITVGGEEKKRWYTLQGQVSSGSATTKLDLYSTTGGNFDAVPVVKADHVGYATLAFTDCQHGSLSYQMGDGRTGNIPLSRLDSNVTCNPTNGAGNGTPPGTFLLSGAWYSPNTSGQGLFFDINPVQNFTAAAWYTYAPNGQGIGGGASQRWYTLQVGSADVGTTPLNNIGIFSAQGGLFDAPSPVNTPQVGTASIAFNTCNALVLSYNFTSGTNVGQSGSINLQRVGPAPAGCSL